MSFNANLRKEKEKKYAYILLLIYIVATAISYFISSVILGMLLQLPLFYRLLIAFIYLAVMLVSLRLIHNILLRIALYIIFFSFMGFLFFILFPAFIIKYDFDGRGFSVEPSPYFSDITTLPALVGILTITVMYISAVFIAGYFITKRARDIFGCLKNGLEYIGFLVIATFSHEVGHWMISFTMPNEIALHLPFGAYVELDITQIPPYRLPFVYLGGIIMNLLFMKYLAYEIRESYEPYKEMYYYSVLVNLVLTNIMPIPPLDGYGYLVSLYILTGNIFLAFFVFLITLYILIRYI
ncbi:MAG: hypothetical protein Q6363_006870, partial [Candidatus Njordarchaeota archaeon]